MSDSTPIPELQRRLVFSLLRGAVRLAARFRMPLKTFEELCRLAYYEELRRRSDAPHTRIAQIFRRSLRTVGALEKQYRGDFLAPEVEVERARRIEAEFADGPRTVAAVAKRLSQPVEEVQTIADALLAAGRLQSAANGRLALNHDYVSLVRQDLKNRVDGLNHQLDVVANAVGARFLDGEHTAIARTFALAALPDRAEDLGDSIVRAVRDRCADAEETALKQGGHAAYAVTLAFTPVRAKESK